MIVELRTYRFHVGKVAEWLAYYEKQGLPVQQKHLGEPLGFFASDIGELNEVVHMWGYASYEDREARRANLFRDPDWRTYLANQPPVILSQSSRVLVPASFSRIK